VTLPETMGELFMTANRVFGIVTAAIRTIDTEARISEIQLIKDRQVVYVTTKEDEKEFEISIM